VLAAGSPVFAAELFGPMKETSTRHVKIDDMEPAIFEALVHFACTGALPDDADGVAPLQHLLVAADRYGMHRLMAACEWKLCQSIDVESVATTLALAEQHHRVKLKDACIGFVSTKSVLAAVRETEGFAHLVETCPLVMVDILEQKLPSRATRFLTLCATQAQRGLILLGTQVRRGRSRLTLFGKKVASSFRRLGDHVDLVHVGIVLGFFSTFGLLVFIIRKLEGDNASQDQRWPPTFSRLDIQQSLQELRSRIAQQLSPLPISPIASLQGWLRRRQDLSSWLPKVSSLARLQEFQESAWLNSDI
jgi:speckle-type POZ protein